MASSEYKPSGRMWAGAISITLGVGVALSQIAPLPNYSSKPEPTPVNIVARVVPESIPPRKEEPKTIHPQKIEPATPEEIGDPTEVYVQADSLRIPDKPNAKAYFNPVVIRGDTPESLMKQAYLLHYGRDIPTSEIGRRTDLCMQLNSIEKHIFPGETLRLEECIVTKISHTPVKRPTPAYRAKFGPKEAFPGASHY